MSCSSFCLEVLTDNETVAAAAIYGWTHKIRLQKQRSKLTRMYSKNTQTAHHPNKPLQIP